MTRLYLVGILFVGFSTSQERYVVSAHKLWSWSRSTAWRKVKHVMEEAGIDTSLPHATPKGLRHGFGIAAILSGMPVNELQKAFGHADLKTTSIYLDAQGKEKRALYTKMWGS